jgi:tetratricopeptide (TPR) repeat protein
MMQCRMGFGILLMLPLMLAAMPQGGDLQAQILYAYQAEDALRLASLIQTLDALEQAGSADDALRYHLAHAEYRLGTLRGAAHSPDAAAAFSDCILALKPQLARDADSVEALVLQAACYANLARFRKLDALLLRAQADQRLGSALRLAPRNPRVLYLAAIDALTRAPSGSAEYALGAARLELAAEIFEQTSATDIDAPGWGHAEAYLELGRLLESRGETREARDWIEKSLIAAPDYRAAQRQLAVLVSH